MFTKATEYIHIHVPVTSDQNKILYLQTVNVLSVALKLSFSFIPHDITLNTRLTPILYLKPDWHKPFTLCLR